MTAIEVWKWRNSWGDFAKRNNFDETRRDTEILYLRKNDSAEIESLIDWDNVVTVKSMIDELMRIWELSNPQLVRLMSVMSMSQEKDMRYSDLLAEMKIAMVESGFDMMTQSQLKCVVALKACSDETML